MITNLYMEDMLIHIAHALASITYNQALKNTTILTSKVMFNMKFLKKEDIYMPNNQRGENSSTWWKVLKKGIIKYGIDEVFSFYRVDQK